MHPLADGPRERRSEGPGALGGPPRLAGLEFATGGLVPGLEEELIDHIAHSPSLTTGALTAIRRLLDGVEVSDHNGVVVDLVPT